MLVALPFAVLEAGGGVTAVGLVVGAQLVPFLVFALIGGAVLRPRRPAAGAHRLGRRPARRAGARRRAAARRRREPARARRARRALRLGRRVLPARVHRPAARRRCRTPGSSSPPTRCAGCRSRWRASPARPSRACSSAASARARRSRSTPRRSPSASLLPAAAAPGLAAAAAEEAPPAPRLVREGWREIRRRSWLAGRPRRHVRLPRDRAARGLRARAVVVARDLGGPGAWAAVVVAFGVGRAHRRSRAAAGPPAARAPRRGRSAWSSPPARPRSTAPGVAARRDVRAAVRRPAIGVTHVLHAVGGLAPGARARRRRSRACPRSTTSRPPALMPVGTIVVGPLAASVGERTTLLGMSASASRPRWPSSPSRRSGTCRAGRPPGPSAHCRPPGGYPRPCRTERSHRRTRHLGAGAPPLGHRHRLHRRARGLPLRLRHGRHLGGDPLHREGLRPHVLHHRLRRVGPAHRRGGRGPRGRGAGRPARPAAHAPAHRASIFLVGIAICSLSPSPRRADSFGLGSLLGSACLGVGAGSMTVPLYIGEVAPPGVRGRLVSVNQLMITTGIVVAYLVDYAFSGSEGWRWMIACASMPSVGLLVGHEPSCRSPRGGSSPMAARRTRARSSAAPSARRRSGRSSRRSSQCHP